MVAVSESQGVGHALLACTQFFVAEYVEELYILAGSVFKILDGKGIKVYRTFVGEYATSMEMAGASISIMKIESEEMKSELDMPVSTPFYTQV